MDSDFPKDILPFDTGLIIADSYDAKILRESPLNKLPAARRKKIFRSMASTACDRLAAYTDPIIR